jgi:hypothetical protein
VDLIAEFYIHSAEDICKFCILYQLSSLLQKFAVAFFSIKKRSDKKKIS